MWFIETLWSIILHIFYFRVFLTVRNNTNCASCEVILCLKMLQVNYYYKWY